MRKGQQVGLTPLQAADAALLYEWINDREQVLLNSAYRPVHDVNHETWFANIRRSPDAVIFGIRLLSDGRLIGTCQLHGIHPVHRSAELQIRIGDVAARGAGRGTEAVQLLLAFAFEDLNLERVFLHVFAENVAALRAYEKAGLVREGLLRQAAYVDGRHRDVVIMSCLRRDRVNRP